MTIRIAAVGTSVITTRFAAAVTPVDGVKVTTVVSRDTVRARAFADSLGIPQVKSFDAALADPAIDAVYLASPNSVHAEQARRALEHGKHVIVEKPAVLHAAEWEELTALAERSSRILMEAIRTLYDPGLDAIRELLPELGTLRRVTLRLEKRSSRYDEVLAGGEPNIFSASFGGGALRDLGVYPLHVLLALFGQPRSVVGAHTMLPSGVDGIGSLLASYDSLIADLHYSKITAADALSVIVGEDGSLTIDDVSNPRTLVLRRRYDGSTRAIEVPAAGELLEGEVRRFVQLITADDGMRLVRRDQARTLQVLRIVDRLARGWPTDALA